MQKYIESTPAHMLRVVEEGEQLKQKLDALISFFEGDTFAKLSEEESYLLTQQAMVMKDYLHILDKRLAQYLKDD